MCNVFQWLYESAQKYPNNTYIIDKGINYTYSYVLRRVLNLAEYYRVNGIKNGDRILIYLDNSVEYVIAYFSTMFSNAIAVPINKNTTIENIQYIINDTNPLMIVTNTLFLKKIDNKVAFRGCLKVNLDILSEEILNNNNKVVFNLTSDINQSALILYTSGTTRMPKGVTLTHKNLYSNTNSIIQYLKLTHEDSLLVIINFCYSYGNSLLLTHTKAGGTLQIDNRASYPAEIAEQLLLSKVTGFSTVGSYINILLKQNTLKENHLKKIKYMTFAGESTNIEDIRKLLSIAPHLEIFVMYGQTEATARLSYLEPSMLLNKLGSVGKGIPGVTLKVINERGQEVTPGEVGEIIAFGDNIMKGYWNNEEETKSVIRDGWLYTGDYATLDEDGYIYIKGRKDDVIKFMGYRISPLEIESILNSNCNVLESAVILLEKDDKKLIKAYVVPNNGSLNTDELYSFIKKRLPSYKRPQVIDFVFELPRTSNGKIKRNELRKAL